MTTQPQVINPYFTKPKSVVKVEDGSDIIAWELHPSGRINAIKQGSGWYGSGVGMGPGAFTETAVGAGIALTQSTYGWGAAYSQSTWVYRCVEVRKQAVNRMPFYVYDKKTGKRNPNHPLLIALAHSKQSIFKKIEQSQILFGETFLEPAKNDYGYYSTIYWLNNLGMAVLIGAGHITGYSYTALQGGRAQQYEYDDLAFMKTDNPFNDLRGMSMLEVAMDEIRIDFDVARVVRAYYANDTRVGLLLIPTKDLSTTDSQRFIEEWKMQNQGADKAGKPVLMPYDMKVERVQNPMTLDDMNLRESTRREICGALGVPLSLAGGWDDAKYQSLPEQRKSFYEETIMPECETIDDFMNIEVMPFYEDGERSVFAHDFTVVLALTEDAQRKGDMYSQRLTSGGITRAEYRQALGHQARPEDEVYYIPAGVTVVAAKDMELVKPQANLVTTSPQTEQQAPALPSGAPPVKPNSETPGGTDTQAEQSQAPHKQLPGNVFSARAPQPTIPPQLIPGKSVTTIQVKQETAEEELAAWEKKAINNNPVKALAFTCFVTPDDVQAVVREALKALGKDAPKAAIRAVFKTAKEAMKAENVPSVALDSLRYSEDQARDANGRWSGGGGGSSGAGHSGSSQNSDKPNGSGAPQPTSQHDPGDATDWGANANRPQEVLQEGAYTDYGGMNSSFAQQGSEYLSRAATKHVTAQQKTAMSEYTGGGQYQDINKFYRGQSGSLSPEAQKNVALLDTAIGQASLPQGVVMYCGMHLAPEAMKNFKPGATFSDPGFGSASLAQNVSDSYLNKEGSGGVMLRIKAPKGSKALPIEAVSDYPEEKEVLLPRGQKFTVTRVKKGAGGRMFVDVQLAE